MHAQSPACTSGSTRATPSHASCVAQWLWLERRRRRGAPSFIEEEEEAPQGAPQVQTQEEEEDELAADDENDPRVRAKKAKIGQLWDLLNSKPGGAPPQKPKAQTPTQPASTSAPATKKPGGPGSSSPSLATLCKPAKQPCKQKGSDEVRLMARLAAHKQQACKRGFAFPDLHLQIKSLRYPSLLWSSASASTLAGTF